MQQLHQINLTNYFPQSLLSLKHLRYSLDKDTKKASLDTAVSMLSTALASACAVAAAAAAVVKAGRGATAPVCRRYHGPGGYERPAATTPRAAGGCRVSLPAPSSVFLTLEVLSPLL